MLLLYKYGLILVILLNINEIRSRTLTELDATELTANNGTSIRSSLVASEASTTESQVNSVGERRGRDSEEENDDDDDEDVEDDESADDDEESEEPSEKAAVLDEEYMKNHDVVDTHMTELYNEVVGKKKGKDSSSKDGGSKYTEEKPEGEKDKVEYEKDKDKDHGGHHGEKSPSKKKKKGGLKEKILPLLIIPYAIQMVVIPLVVFKLKMLALKAMAIGKLAILILLFNYFKYQHNAKTSHVDEQYVHDNQLLSEHYGYSGAPEVGGWVNGRSMEQFSRRRRR